MARDYVLKLRFAAVDMEDADGFAEFLDTLLHSRLGFNPCGGRYLSMAGPLRSFYTRRCVKEGFRG